MHRKFSSQRRERRVTEITNPFKGLESYSKKDYGRLFGRDKDLFLMKDRIFKAKTTLLFAGTGVGKTSFLNAKVIPEIDQRYFISYHNQWSVDDPLVTMKKNLCEELATGRPDLEDRKLADYFEAGDHSLKDFCHCYLKSHFILILDQFEELFRYHAFETYFQKFLDEICEIINDDQLQIRIIFSMRQEFLGDLSIFDNHIPDLFNNYYHLTHPDKIQTEEIITKTTMLIVGDNDTNSVRVDEKALEFLIHDLSKIEKEATPTKETAITKKRELLRDFVEPPYLQIVCQRLWNEQLKLNSPEIKNEFTFLKDYQPGSAMEMLKIFCHEKLEGLSTKEKDVVAAAFDFLITSYGSKRAYDLDSLARHMKKNRARLLKTLEKLSDKTVRMLRITRRPDKSIWFELYHDMFSSIVYIWKEAYQKKRRKNIIIKNMSIAIIITAIVLGSGYYTYQFYYEKWYVIDPLRNGFVALKEGKASIEKIEKFRRILTKAKVNAPGSSGVNKFENDYKDFLEKSFVETEDLSRADTILQVLRDEFPDKEDFLSNLSDDLLGRKMKNVEEEYNDMVGSENSAEDFERIKEFLDSKEALLGSNAKILDLQLNLAKRRGQHEIEQQLMEEKARKQELARKRLSDAIKLKIPTGNTVKGGLKGVSAEFEIVLENNPILQKAKQVFIDKKPMLYKGFGKEELYAGTVMIPKEANEITIKIKAIDREGNEGVKHFTFIVDRQPPELTSKQFLYRNNPSENWQAMPEGRWVGKFWRIEGESSEALSSASLTISIGNKMNPLPFQISLDKNHLKWTVEGKNTWLQNTGHIKSTISLEDQVGWKNSISLGKRFHVFRDKPKTEFRSIPEENLTEKSVKFMLEQNNFFCSKNDWTNKYCNPSGSGFDNKFEKKNSGQVVYDHASGLMWQQSGSSEYISHRDAKAYIIKLNSEQFAGYSDWRLPTLEEAMSLVKPTEKNGDLFIDPVFAKTQRYIWTSDLVSASRAWVVYFDYGGCYNDDLFYDGYCVRAVR